MEYQDMRKKKKVVKVVPEGVKPQPPKNQHTSNGDTTLKGNMERAGFIFQEDSIMEECENGQERKKSCFGIYLR